MMSVRVLSWSTWIPESEKTRTIPELPAAPPLLRRRMSRLTRMALAAAMECCRQARVSAADVQAVFASRHGEMAVTAALLEQMMRGDTLSPMDFSGSVHHTALGYFSLAVKNRQAMRAVAAGEASFCCGFLDAMGMLNPVEGKPVLLIAAEDSVPPPFAKAAGKKNRPYAAAFLLGRGVPGRAGTVSFRMSTETSHAKKNGRERIAQGVPALNFLQWLQKGEKSLDMALAGKIWRWER